MKRKHKTNHRLRLDRDLIYTDDLFKEFADEAIDIIGVVWEKKIKISERSTNACTKKPQRRMNTALFKGRRHPSADINSRH